MEKDTEDNINSLGLFVADHVSAMLAYWDKDLVCRFANAAYMDWFGKTREEMIDKITIKELLGPLYEKNLIYVTGALQGKKQTFEREITLPSGEVRYSIANYFPDIEDGKVKGFFVHVADITSVKLLEKELVRSNEIIGEQNKRLISLAEERAQAYRKERELLNRDIHEHKIDKEELEKAVKRRTVQLEQKNTELESLFQYASMGIILVNEEGDIMKINPHAEGQFGYSKDELIGKKIETLVPKRLAKRHVGHRKKYNRNPHPREMGAQMELFGLKKGGKEFPVEINLSPYATSKGHAVIVFIVDITERKQKEEEIRKSREALETSYEILRESEENYRDLFENQLAPMYSTDMKTSKTIMVNDVGAQLFGYKTKEDFLKYYNPLDHFVDPGERGKNMKLAKELGELTKIQEMKKVDGTHFWAKLYIKLSSGKQMAQTIIIDITEQVKAEELLTAKVHELEKMNKELETFTFISSHDLQEPLRKIRNFVTVLLKNEKARLSTEGQQYLQNAYKSASRMQMLMEDLLTYLRIKNADRKFEKMDVAKIAREVVADIKEDMVGKNVIVKIEGSSRINVIPFQVRQLFQNFISNSIKFSHSKRQLRITIRTEIKAGSELSHHDLKPEKKYCHIAFSDNGIGFDPKYKDRIFVVFQRLHSVEKYKGSGIGLAICKRIVENHDGVITATGEPNKGAAFDIYIPIA